MEVSWNWLSEWVNLDGLDVDEVGHRLTMAGLEVDGLRRVGEGLDDIVVGRIDAIEEHAEADNLVICRVDIGDGSMRRIVCGATNMEVGDRVPVARPGSQPPAVDFEITRREVMGVDSEGMLCSAEELGYAESSEGLWVLPESVEVGRPVFEALGLKDTVFELDLTPNRADCFSHLGVAREIAGLFGRTLSDRDRRHLASYPWRGDDTGEPAESIASLHVEDPAGCPRYAFAVLEDIQVGRSPMWLRQRLKSIGVRPVNNVVDVTNYLLMDLGQPLHAFDLDELRGPEVQVRRARASESIVGIDHQEYSLTTEDLVIADAERPVAIAGVMGGAQTEVGGKTDRVLLECATFDPRTVRRTASRFDLSTDASHRFERGVDPNMVEDALARAVSLIESTQMEQEGTVPQVASGIALNDVEGATAGWTIQLDPTRVRDLLGLDVEVADITEILERLEMTVEQDVGPDQSELAVEIPTFRADVTRPVDLIEEVARVYGFDEVPETLPERSMGGQHSLRPEEEREAEPTLVSGVARNRRQRIRHLLGDTGFREALNHSFMGADQLDELRVPEDDRRRETVQISNPLRSNQQYLRTTMLPSLVRNLRDNRAQNNQDVALYELGRVYFPESESMRLGLLASGEAASNWDERRRWDFFDFKGVLEAIADVCGVGADPDSTEQIAAWSEPETQNPTLHPGVQAVWRPTGGKVVGEVGRLHPRIERELEIDGPVVVAEVELEELLEIPARTDDFDGLSAYPGVRRDMAVVVDGEVSYAQLRAAIDDHAERDEAFGDLLESIELFDVYRGEQVAEGSRSLALSLQFRAEDRTLTEEEVAEVDEALMAHLEEAVGAVRR